MKTPNLILFCFSITIIHSKTISKNSRIIGGEEAFAGEFPYAAAIYKTTADGSYFCTGSILGEEWIITAGQCVDRAISFTIIVGTHKLDGDEATAEKLATSEYVLHPDFNPETLENDIGLIKLRAPITYNDYIQKVYLPFFIVSEGATGTAFGWGQTTDKSPGLSNTLRHVTLQLMSDTQCKTFYGDQFRGNMMCFEGNYNEGTCYGDSGGPILFRYRGDSQLIIGISSFFSGNGCESTDPSGYTNVLPYTDWIKTIIN